MGSMNGWEEPIPLTHTELVFLERTWAALRAAPPLEGVPSDEFELWLWVVAGYLAWADWEPPEGLQRS